MSLFIFGFIVSLDVENASVKNGFVENYSNKIRGIKYAIFGIVERNCIIFMILKRRIYGYIDMITLPFRVSPFYSFIFGIVTIMNALIPTLSIYVTASFLNSSIAVFSKQGDISSVYVSIALISLIMIYNALNGTITSFMQIKRSIYFRNKISPEIINKIANLEYSYLENAKIMDLIMRVCPSIEKNIWDMYMRILEVVDFVVYLLGIILVIFTQVWWLSIAMIVTIVPTLFIATKAGKYSYSANKKITEMDRKIDYLSRILKCREAVEERSMYCYANKINTQYSEKYKIAYKYRVKVMRDNFIKQKLGGLLTIIYSILAILAAIPLVIDGIIDYGMFIALLGAIFGLSSRLSWGVNQLIVDLTHKREYLKDLTDFVHLHKDEDATVLPEINMEFKIIEFKNVSFRYPGTKKLILDNVSFKIERGKHYSFVGANGAGKSTVTKLIAGLYTEYEGDILFDGRPLRHMTQSQIKGFTSIVHQDFARYYMSMYDNIAIANLNDFDNRKEVERVVKLVGLSDVVAKLKNGLDTPLGKIAKDGMELSGGEWQRVAMARIVISKSPLKILDEPTAALDPIAESILYNNYEHIFTGITTIFISHRLGSTKLADKIYVFHGGKIVESGSHSSLIAENGEYARMFNSQAEWYNITTDDLKRS